MSFIKQRPSRVTELFRAEKPRKNRDIVIVQEMCESRGGRPELSVLTSFLVSVDVNYTEPCFGNGHSLSLICQLTSEDIKLHFTM